MAALLRTVVAFVTIAAIVFAAPVGWVPLAIAQSQVQGKFTGYAFGNATGANGTPVENRDFANHTPVKCPGDPAAQWAYGSTITTIDPASITEWNEWGSATGYVWFILEDTGDFSCSQGNYWADIYFGRHKLAVDPCDCGGVDPSGFCRDDQAGFTGNACTDALNFGFYMATYWSP